MSLDLVAEMMLLLPTLATVTKQAGGPQSLNSIDLDGLTVQRVATPNPILGKPQLTVDDKSDTSSKYVTSVAAFSA